jgi:hypothetical protein
MGFDVGVTTTKKRPMLASKISYLTSKIKSLLFHLLDKDSSDTPLLECHQRVLYALEIIQIEQTVRHYTLSDRGRPPKHHACIARALIAKHVLNLPTTSHLIHRLLCDKHLRYICDWMPGEKVPSESTFSRVFAYLSETRALEYIHEKLVQSTFEGHLVLHAARDSCPIEVREREEKSDINTRKKKKAGKSPKKAYKKSDRYPCKSAEGKQITVCEYQMTCSNVAEAVRPLKTSCDIGKKTNPYGISKCWRGYKLHVDVAEGSFPISCILTSASTHDSQAAIPLSMKTKTRVTALYELMDSAYDADAIKKYIEEQGRVPLIKAHKRRGKECSEANEKAYEALNWRPADEERFKTRFSNERIFARLKDSFLGSVWVRGHVKVFCHVMLGILSLYASELSRFWT